MEKLSTGSSNSTYDREMDTFSNSALYYEEMDLLPNSTNMAFHSKEMDPNIKSNLNSPFLDKEIDPIYKDDMDFIRGNETDPDFHPTPCSSACAVGISGTSSGKLSRVKKHPDQIPKGSTNNTKSSCQGSCPSTCYYPTQSPSPRLPTILETSSMSTCTSTSTATSIATKLSDAKNSDSITLSQGRSSRPQSDGALSVRPHTGGDCPWEAVGLANARESPLGLDHFRLLKRLGYGDIGSVYLVELRGT